MFLFALLQKGRAQRQTLRHQRVESFDAVRVPSTMGEREVTFLQGARGGSLQAGGVVDF